MLSAGSMTEQVQAFRKGVEGTSPEEWVSDGVWRRARISRVGSRAALEENVAYEVNVTHRADVDYREDIYETEGHGARLLKRQRDGANFMITRVIGIGLRGRRGNQRYMRLTLTTLSPAEV